MCDQEHYKDNAIFLTSLKIKLDFHKDNVTNSIQKKDNKNF